MKKSLRAPIYFSFTMIAIIMLNSAFQNPDAQNQTGTGAATGAPGELTCSESGCHGAGNGNSTTGGLPDNGGPGSITIGSVPAINFNSYIPNQTYHMSVTISETGKAVFGFDFEALDNSGNTNLHIDNTVGTFNLTDLNRTRYSFAYGTGRKTVTFKLDAGFTPNSSTYYFDWTAPNSGIVNWFATGVAGNHDGFCSSIDNVYRDTLQLSPGVLNISNQNANDDKVDVFPNPASEYFTVSYAVPTDARVIINLFDCNGKLVEQILNEEKPSGNYFTKFNISNRYPVGNYILQTTCGEKKFSNPIIITR